MVGEVVVSGYLTDLLSAKKNTSKSRTLGYLRKELEIEVPKERRKKDKGSLK
jgi:excinuclease UvrABC ATPase subunit